VTSPTDFKTIHEAIQIYERASGARLNPPNSHALAIGHWTTPETDLGIDFQSRLKILGVNFGRTIKESTTATWIHVTEAIRAQARKAFAIELRFAQRIQYVQPCLLAKIWYVAQILPPNKAHTHTHTTTDNNMHVVYMARKHLPRTDHYAPSAEDARRLGDVGCGSQV
jgi:hypothetical protein